MLVVSGPAWADAPAPAFGAPAPGYGTPGGYGAPGGYGTGPASQPGNWLLPLTSAAKVLVTTFIVLGAICEVGQNVYNMESGNSTVNNNGTSTSVVINL